MTGTTTKRVTEAPAQGATKRITEGAADGSSKRVDQHDAYNPWGETWFGANAQTEDCWDENWEVGKSPAIGSTHTKRVTETPVSS